MEKYRELAKCEKTYRDIWTHPKISEIMLLHHRIDMIIDEIDIFNKSMSKKKISYTIALKKAIEYSPMSNQYLLMPFKEFKIAIEHLHKEELSKVTNELLGIYNSICDGITTNYNLQGFVADYSYKLKVAQRPNEGFGRYNPPSGRSNAFMRSKKIPTH